MQQSDLRRRLVTYALWGEVALLIVVGSIMTAVRTVTPEEVVPQGDGTVTVLLGDPYDIWPIGVALLCVGLALLGAILLVEAYGTRRGSPSSLAEAERDDQRQAP